VPSNPQYRVPSPELNTDRLILRLITAEDIAAVMEDRRQPSWAPDFPSPGDREIAGLLSRIGVPAGAGAHFGHRLVLERKSELVIGGVGFFGPPENGRVEIGYGIVESWRCRGYATEAVVAMLQFALTQPRVTEVIATTDPGNTASLRVLEKSGLSYQSRDDSEVVYLINSPH
jgi:RimJ/RimL family protein N-acetyltransferase